MREVYFKIELVKQLSLLTLILRAVPAPIGSPTSITDECAAAAHETLDMHHQCMAAIQDNKDDQFMTNRYLHWYVPSPPPPRRIELLKYLPRLVRFPDLPAATKIPRKTRR